MTNVKSGLIWNSIQQIGQLGISFVATIVLSRMLTPDDYGVFAILMIFVGLGERLSDSGMGGYLIKKKNANKRDFSTLFVYNTVVSGFIYIILYFSAPVIEKFFNTPHLTSAIRAIGFLIIIQALSVTQISSLFKEFQFKALAVISLIAGIISLIIAIILAYYGYGFWALIWQQIISVSINTLLCIVYNKYIPSFRFYLDSFKEQWAFGINLLGATVLKIIKTNISNNFIGKILNIEAAGYYSQANRLQNYPTSMVTNVVEKTFFPVFSKINDNPKELNRQYIITSREIYAFMFPIFSLIICFSDQIINLVLGSKWLECVPIFTIIMTASYPMLIVALNRNLFKSIGKTGTIFKIELISFIILLITFGIIILYNHPFVELFAYSIVITQYATAIFSIYYIKKNTGISILLQIRDIFLFTPFAVILVIPYFLGSTFIIRALEAIVIIIFSVGFYTYFGIDQYKKLLKFIKY